jgi:hypothetical protein
MICARGLLQDAQSSLLVQGVKWRKYASVTGSFANSATAHGAPAEASTRTLFLLKRGDRRRCPWMAGHDRGDGEKVLLPLSDDVDADAKIDARSPGCCRVRNGESASKAGKYRKYAESFARLRSLRQVVAR